MLGFRNRQLHGLLDWRLGYDMIRTMFDASYSSGLDGHFDASVSLNGWIDTATGLREEFLRFLPGATANVAGNLPAISLQDGTTYVITHPFWSTSHAQGELAQAVAGTRAVDTFNLARRMAWCTKHLPQFPEIRPLSAPVGIAAPVVPAEVPEIAAGVEFNLSTNPPGMPSGCQPRFRGITADENPSIQSFYLVQDNLGEPVVGRVQRQQLGNGEHLLRFQPGNHLDGDLPPVVVPPIGSIVYPVGATGA